MVGRPKAFSIGSRRLCCSGPPPTPFPHIDLTITKAKLHFDFGGLGCHGAQAKRHFGEVVQPHVSATQASTSSNTTFATFFTTTLAASQLDPSRPQAWKLDRPGI